MLPLPNLQWTKPIISCCWEGGWTQKTAKPPAVKYPYLMVSDEAFWQFLFATCGSLVGSFWNSYHLGSYKFPVQFFFYVDPGRNSFDFDFWRETRSYVNVKIQPRWPNTYLFLWKPLSCVFTVCFFSLCPGVSIRAEEGLGHQQYKHEAVCQSDAHADGRQTQIQAPVEEGGVSHTAVLPLLHLPPWRKGHVSLLLSPVVPSQCLQEYGK